jgi:hypothetical protein
MPRTKKHRLQAAAAARAAKARRKKALPDDNLDIEITNHPSLPNGEEGTATSAVMPHLFPGSHSDSEDECGWDGTVNNVPTSDSDSDFEPDSYR